MNKRTKEFRGMDVGQQRTELMGLLREQFNLRMQKATSQLGKSSELGRVRHEIARLRTLMGEKRA